MRKWINEYQEAASNIILGKQEQTNLALTCLLASGHLLIEDRPGVGKTTMAKFLSKVCGLEMSRIQFTNDLLPSDILGFNIYNNQNQNFIFQKGPIFGQLILADELNRTTPKTQSALLQVMEESQVTIDGQTYELPSPFFVIATQNPSNQIGTNLLPESQVDRFLMKLEMGHPNPEAEKKLLLGEQRSVLIEKLDPIILPEQLITAQKEADQIKVSPSLAEYIIKILITSRSDSHYNSLSSRAGIDLIKASKAWCYIQGKKFVEPEDVQAIVSSVIGHRLVPTQSSGTHSEQQLVQELVTGINIY